MADSPREPGERRSWRITSLLTIIILMAVVLAAVVFVVLKSVGNAIR